MIAARFLSKLSSRMTGATCKSDTIGKRASCTRTCVSVNHLQTTLEEVSTLSPMTCHVMPARACRGEQSAVLGFRCDIITGSYEATVLQARRSELRKGTFCPSRVTELHILLPDQNVFGNDHGASRTAHPRFLWMVLVHMNHIRMKRKALAGYTPYNPAVARCTFTHTCKRYKLTHLHMRTQSAAQ